MAKFLGTDVLDGTIINWDDLSLEKLEKIKEQLEIMEKRLKEEIDSLIEG